MSKISEPLYDTADTADLLDRSGWLTLLRKMGEDSGSFTPLGDRHWAIFNEDGPKLVISFDRLEDIQALEPGKMPHIFGQATHNGWSHLSLISEGDTWYRDGNVFTVLAIQPRASLDPEITGWDTRFTAARRLNFTDRYGYAPEMTEGAAKVFTLHDPYARLDAMHVALFRKPYVTNLKARFLGDHVAVSLSEMGIMPKIVKAACDGTLTAKSYAKLWRERRHFGNYLRWILHACSAAGHAKREAMICRSVTNRLRAPSFRKHLEKLEKSGVLDRE
jgi:hypothetical protein